jgi:hypothetical protein
MKNNNLELFDTSFVDLTLDEQLQVTGGSALSEAAGFIAGRAVACVFMVYAAGCLAVSIGMNEGGYSGGGSA